MKRRTNDQNNRIAIRRYGIIFAIILIFGCYVMSKVATTMFTSDRAYWTTINKRFTSDLDTIQAVRGRILAADGQELAVSVPEYRLFLDFKIGGGDSAQNARILHWRDTTLMNNLDSISNGLARILPDKSAAWFKERLLAGRNNPKKQWSYPIYTRRVNYMQYKACKELPLFNADEGIGGFHGDEEMQRIQPFGGLARRTIGVTSQKTDRTGLELAFDSVLRGKPGLAHRSHVRNKRVNFYDVVPIDGNDILTTIDMGIQDYAEQVLRAQLINIGAEIGVAIVMDVKTGDIKAMVNLSQGDDGGYYEMVNNAMSALWEPGSTFKTASILVGMDDGYIKKTDAVNCSPEKQPGIMHMYGHIMRDHNWHRGGYKTLTVSQILEKSSNIGVSYLIDRAYKDNPQAFIDGLRRAGVGIDLELTNMSGMARPVTTYPGDPKRYWSKSDLPWMSIGYVSQLTPLNTLTFYNAIANNGKMVKPRLVKAEMKDGHVIREYPTEVLRESIVKHPETLTNIREFLYNVVDIGLGARASSAHFKVSGKTGTAQMEYRRGVANKHMVSFCGYFPSDDPQYSCIVCIVHSKSHPSGGSQSGPVFQKIAEYAMACSKNRPVKKAADSTATMEPSVAVMLPDTASLELMPDVQGMGAKDAIYELQRRGMKVRIEGCGRVTKQSIKAGTQQLAGKTVTLTLE